MTSPLWRQRGYPKPRSFITPEATRGRCRVAMHKARCCPPLERDALIHRLRVGEVLDQLASLFSDSARNESASSDECDAISALSARVAIYVISVRWSEVHSAARRPGSPPRAPGDPRRFDERTGRWYTRSAHQRAGGECNQPDRCGDPKLKIHALEFGASVRSQHTSFDPSASGWQLQVNKLLCASLFFDCRRKKPEIRLLFRMPIRSIATFRLDRDAPHRNRLDNRRRSRPRKMRR